MGALALQNDDLHSAAVPGAVVPQQNVIGAFLRRGPGFHGAGLFEEAGLQRHLCVDGVELPTRVLPAQQCLGHHESQPDAKLLGLSHLVVVYGVAGVPGERKMALALGQRRAVTDVRPVPGNLRQRSHIQERGGHARTGAAPWLRWFGTACRVPPG